MTNRRARRLSKGLLTAAALPLVAASALAFFSALRRAAFSSLRCLRRSAFSVLLRSTALRFSRSAATRASIRLRSSPSGVVSPAVPYGAQRVPWWLDCSCAMPYMRRGAGLTKVLLQHSLGWAGRCLGGLGLGELGRRAP